MKASSLKTLIKSIFVLIIALSSCKAQEKYKEDMPYASANAELDRPKKSHTKRKLIFGIGVCSVLVVGVGGIANHKKIYSLFQSDTEPNSPINPKILAFIKDHAKENKAKDRKFEFPTSEYLDITPEDQALGLRSLEANGVTYKRPGTSVSANPGYYKPVGKMGLYYLNATDEEKINIQETLKEAADTKATTCMAGAIITVIRLLGKYNMTSEKNVGVLVSHHMINWNADVISEETMSLVYNKDKQLPFINYDYLQKEFRHVPSSVYKNIGHKLGLDKARINTLSTKDRYNDLADHHIYKLYPAIISKVNKRFQQESPKQLAIMLNKDHQNKNHWFNIEKDGSKFLFNILNGEQDLINLCFTDDTYSAINENGTMLILNYMGWLNADGTANLEDEKQKIVL
ncbi:MAG: hypothetical protein AAF380_00805 [Bacteroidota bacterium]